MELSATPILILVLIERSKITLVTSMLCTVLAIFSSGPQQWIFAQTCLFILKARSNFIKTIGKFLPCIQRPLNFFEATLIIQWVCKSGSTGQFCPCKVREVCLWQEFIVFSVKIPEWDPPCLTVPIWLFNASWSTLLRGWSIPLQMYNNSGLNWELSLWSDGDPELGVESVLQVVPIYMPEVHPVGPRFVLESEVCVPGSKSGQSYFGNCYSVKVWHYSINAVTLWLFKLAIRL